MTNCSNSFQALMNNRMNKIIRPYTHRPHNKSKEELNPSFKPMNKYLTNIKHERSFTNIKNNKSIEKIEDQHKNVNIINKCISEEDIQSFENNIQQRRKILKNINQSTKAIRPSVPKKIEDINITSIVATKPFRNLALANLQIQRLQQKEQKSTQRKKYNQQQIINVQNISMVKTKSIKSPRSQSPNILHQTVKNQLKGYKIAQSKIIMNSQIYQQLRVQQSIIDQRDFIGNFVIIKDLQLNRYFSQHVAIEKQVGLVISLKRVKSDFTKQISTEQLIYSILKNQHPNVLHIYQGIMNGQSQFLFLRQFYDNYLKYELLNCADFKKYFKYILMIVDELRKKKILYELNLYQNMVISRNICKLMNFQQCQIQQQQWKLRRKYKNILRNILDIMVNQVSQKDISKDQQFKDFKIMFQKSEDFIQIANHQYLVQTSTCCVI